MLFSSPNVTGVPRVSVRFEIGQHRDSQATLEAIQSYFGCGSIYLNSSDGIYRYNVDKFHDLTHIIIPHFQTYPLRTSKASSFNIFGEVCTLVEDKAHLDPEGFFKIVELSYDMNPGGKRKLTLENWKQVCGS